MKLRDGVVSAVYSGKYLVRDREGEWVSTLKGKGFQGDSPVVGDQARFVVQTDQTGTIQEILPRRNTLTRRVANRGRRTRAARPQILAANVDQLIIVAALVEPPFRPGLVERFLVAAAMARARPLLCLTKLDLAGSNQFEEVVATYPNAFFPIIGTATSQPETLQVLADHLKGCTSVFAGHSGVGKTSLINLLTRQDMAVGELGGQQVARGRHTTTTARLIELESGGSVIDSPGIREYGLYGVEPADLARHYPDFHIFLDQCGFRDCLHLVEPNCVIREAVEKGELSENRYESYLALMAELEAEK